MSTIQTSITMADNISSTLHNITNALNLVMSAFNGVQNAADVNVMDSIHGQVNAATIAVQAFDKELEAIQNRAVPVPITPVWNADSRIDIFQNTGIDRLNLEMGSLNDTANEVMRTQQRIGEQALNMELLPHNASEDINATNQRIEELAQRMTVLQEIDISTMDSASVERVNSEFETMRSGMNSIVNLQEQMNTAIESGDISQLNAGYNQLNNIAEQVERRVRATTATISEMNNVQWVTPPTAEVFVSDGTERYRQEISSANDMLTRLAANQQNIAAQAASSRIFPPNAVNDITAVNARIDRIRQTIQLVEANPLNSIGTAEINNEVERLRGMLNQALVAQEQLNNAAQNMDISGANSAYARLNSIIDGTDAYIRDNIDAQGQFNAKVEQGTSVMDSLQNKISGMAAAYLSIRTAGQVLNLSDTMAQTEARLNLIVDDGGSVDALQNKLHAMAQRTGSNYLDLAENVSKMGLLASNAFSNNDELLAFTELLNKNFAIGGASIQEQASAMYQLTQAMAAGKLQGDEGRSIIENAPLLANAIEQYMRNAGVEGTLKDWMSSGKITAEVIKNSLFAIADETNERYENIPKTFAGAFARMKDDALQTIQPLIDKMSEAAEWIHANWETVSPVFYGVAAALAVVVTAFGIWKIATIAQTIATWGLNAALFANPITWIVIAIAAIVAAIVIWINRVGGLRVAWLITVNAILTALDWMKIGFFVAVYWILDLWDEMNIGLMSVGVAIENSMGDMRANVLMELQKLINGAINFINEFIAILNKLPAVNIDLVRQFSFGTSAQLENEVAKHEREALFDASRNELEASIEKRASALDSMKNDALAATAERLAGINAARMEGDSGGGEYEQIEASPYDNTEDMLDGIAGNASDIARNTGDIAAISEEDLKYFRDMAEREAINRFTTAEVRVEFSGGINNTVSNEMDLAGMVEYIGECVSETLFSVAEGVHA